MNDILPNLDSLRGIVDRKVTENRDVRDGLNGKVREHVGIRNTFNSEVRQLISKVQHQKGIRGESNGAVREAKSERAEKNQMVRDAKDKLRELSPKGKHRRHGGPRRLVGRHPTDLRAHDTPASLRRKIEILEDEFGRGVHTGKNQTTAMLSMKQMKRKLRDMIEKEDSNVELKQAREQLRVAIASQESAHQIVESAFQISQEAHDLMLRLSEEVDKLREQADASHAQVRRAKREADRAHQTYIVSLRCLHSIHDIVRAKNNKDAGIDTTKEEEELEDLEPLTDEQIQTAKESIMEYYENSNPKSHDGARKHSDFIESIEYDLVPGAHRMKILSYRVGVLIGRKGGFIRPLQDKLSEQFPQIRIEMENIKKSKEHSKTNKPKGHTEYNFGEEE